LGANLGANLGATTSGQMRFHNGYWWYPTNNGWLYYNNGTWMSASGTPYAMGNFRWNDGYWWQQGDNGWTYFRDGAWYDTNGNFVVQAEPLVTQQLGAAIGGQAGAAVRNFGRALMGPGGTYYDRGYRSYNNFNVPGTNLNVPGTNLNVPGGWNQGYRGNTGVGSAIGGAIEGAIRGGNVQGGGNVRGGGNFGGGGLFQ
jgi:hypothetical protein